jgi:hypothetical protein
MRSQSDTLIMITESLSTRYIGPFPDYLTAVNELINTASSEIHMVTGNPTPAYFTAPALWLDYVQAIERKARSGAAVRLICSGETLRRQRLEQQFPSSKQDWDEWVANKQSEVAVFLRFRYPEIKVAELDHTKFLELLQATQRDLLREALKLNGVDVLEVNQIVPVQVWIADRARAVFSIQTLQPNALSHGLYTSDARFVSALLSMIEFYEKAV